MMKLLELCEAGTSECYGASRDQECDKDHLDRYVGSEGSYLVIDVHEPWNGPTEYRIEWFNPEDSGVEASIGPRSEEQRMLDYEEDPEFCWMCDIIDLAVRPYVSDVSDITSMRDYIFSSMRQARLALAAINKALRGEKKLRFKSPDKCPCGHELPWHLIDLTEPGERFSHMCSCGRKFELSREVRGRMLYVGKLENPWASVT